MSNGTGLKITRYVAGKHSRHPAYRELLQQGQDIRVRALFVKNLSGPALQMLGGKYVAKLHHKV